MIDIRNIKFKDKKDNKHGFEIISLKKFFETTNHEYISKSSRTEFYNIIFISSGNYTHEIDFVEYKAKENEILTISKDRVHRYLKFDESIDGYLIMFTEEFLSKYLKESTCSIKNLFNDTYLNPCTQLLNSDVEILTSLFSAMISMFSRVEIDMKEVIASNLKTIVTILNNIDKKSTKEESYNSKFVVFHKLLKHNLHCMKTVGEYADKLYISKKTLNLVTKKATGMTAKDYITQQLITLIKINLYFEDKSINEISNELGFLEASNMTKFFKRYTGLTPKEFRMSSNNFKFDSYDKWQNNRELTDIKESIKENVYLITKESKVELHKHDNSDELFYCIKGTGYGVRKDSEEKLEVGDCFIVRAGEKHSLRSDDELYVCSIMIPSV